MKEISYRLPTPVLLLSTFLVALGILALTMGLLREPGRT